MVVEQIHHLTLSFGGNLTHRHIGNALHKTYLTAFEGRVPLPEPPEKEGGDNEEKNEDGDNEEEEAGEGQHFGQGWHLPNADWELSIKVGKPPPGMQIPPHDHAEAMIRSKMEELSKQREMEADAMRKAQLDLERQGRGHPGGLENMNIPSPGDIAQQLMQSGDYGNGLPYHLENPPVEPFKKKLPAHALPTKVVAMGQGHSYEFIECWTGTTRVRCPWDPPPPRRCDSAMPIAAMIFADWRHCRRRTYGPNQGVEFL